MDSLSQWYGNAEGHEQQPIEARLVEFAENRFSNNMAYQTLYRSILCDPDFLLCPREHWMGSLLTKADRVMDFVDYVNKLK